MSTQIELARAVVYSFNLDSRPRNILLSILDGRTIDPELLRDLLTVREEVVQGEIDRISEQKQEMESTISGLQCEIEECYDLIKDKEIAIDELEEENLDLKKQDYWKKRHDEIEQEKESLRNGFDQQIRVKRDEIEKLQETLSERVTWSDNQIKRLNTEIEDLKKEHETQMHVVMKAW